MNSFSIAKGIVKAVSFFLIIGLLLYVVYQIRFLVMYIVIAIGLALLGRPLVSFLEKRFHVNSTYGAVLTVTIIFILLLGLIAMFVPMLTEQGKNLAIYKFDGIQYELDKFFGTVSDYLGTSKEKVEEAVKEGTLKADLNGDAEGKTVKPIVETLMAVFTQMSLGLFSVIFITFFMLKNPNSILLLFLAMVPKSHRERVLFSLEKIKDLLSRYFLGLFLQIFALFVIYSITLILVGTENALLVAFFCALFNIVPYVGPLIGAMLMALLTITSHADMDLVQEVLPMVGYVMIGVFIGQLVDNFVSQPFIYSNSIKSHPLEIFVLIIAAGLLFGIVGMMVAVPCYAIIKVVAREFFQENEFIRTWTKGI